MNLVSDIMKNIDVRKKSVDSVCLITTLRSAMKSRRQSYKINLDLNKTKLVKFLDGALLQYRLNNCRVMA